MNEDASHMPEGEDDDAPEFETGANFTPPPDPMQQQAKPQPAPNTLPLPMPAPPAPLDREKIKRFLKNRFGIDGEELDVLYPDDDKLKNFYENIARKAKNLGGATDEKAPLDNYKMSADEKREAEEALLLQKRRSRDAAAKAEIKQKKEFEKAGSHLPKNEQVSWADAQAAMNALNARKRKKKGAKDD